MDHTHTSFFQSRQKPLFLLASLYVLGLIVTHAAVPAMSVWAIAALFSILMNFTYITEAVSMRRWIGTESIVAAALIAGSLLGLVVHPLFVIAAIAGHGLWDLAKHHGAGVPFFSWYTLGCCAVDLTYSSVLFAYWWLHG